MDLQWHGESASIHTGTATQAANFDCTANGIEEVTCNVYDEGGGYLATGGSWPCDAGNGLVGGIPPGRDRTFVIMANDAAGNISYHGQRSGVTIESGKTTDGVMVDVYPFIPILSAPADGAELDPNGFLLEWAELENAGEYYVTVAQDLNFETLAIEDTTQTNSYAPTTLSPSSRYFWKIQAVDSFGNLGAESEAGSFTTSDCTYTISSDTNNLEAEGGSGSFDITASAEDCGYAASTREAWIRITAGGSGSGYGVIEYTVTANPASTERTGTISAGGQSHTITQQGLDCTYQLSPVQERFASEGGSGSIEISASADDCPWSAQSSEAWIEITSNADGGGLGSVTYTVAPNPTAEERTGTITVGGERCTITQDPSAACTFEISPPSMDFDATGGSGTVQITASAENCSWDAVADDAWIIITAGESGVGSGEVAYDVEPYVDGDAQRDGTLTIAEEVHRVTQTPPRPQAPENLSVGYGASGWVAQWDEVSPAPDSYRLYVHTQGEAYDYETPLYTGTMNLADYPMDVSYPLEIGNIYYFVVRAYANGFESVNSNEYRLDYRYPFPSGEAPPVPENLRVGYGASGWMAYWDEVSPAPEGYHLYVRTEEETFDYTKPLYDGGINYVSHPDNVSFYLVDGNIYYFVVRAYANDNESADSNEYRLDYSDPFPTDN